METVELLTQFGLTEYEAKTLSALFKLSEAEAPEISRNAQVPKTRVYDVLENLIAKKMVMEINGRPKKYKVVSPNETFSQLISNKKTELNHLEEQAIELANSLSRPGDLGDLGEKVMKVKDKNDFFKILNHEISKAKSEVVCFTKIGKKFSLLGDSLKKAAKNSVTVKILHHDETEKAMLADLSKNGVQTKLFSHGLNAFVIDNKKVILFLSDPEQEKSEYHFTIWPHNAGMANLFTHYFNHNWEKTQ